MCKRIETAWPGVLRGGACGVVGRGVWRGEARVDGGARQEARGLKERREEKPRADESEEAEGET